MVTKSEGFIGIRIAFTFIPMKSKEKQHVTCNSIMSEMFSRLASF